MQEVITARLSAAFTGGCRERKEPHNCEDNPTGRANRYGHRIFTGRTVNSTPSFLSTAFTTLSDNARTGLLSEHIISILKPTSIEEFFCFAIVLPELLNQLSTFLQPSIKEIPTDEVHRLEAEISRRQQEKDIHLAKNSASVTYGLKNITDKKLTGIPGDMLKNLIRVVEQNDCVLALRPVEPVYQQLMTGGYAHKDITIKGKTANWGLHAGFIPCRQELSKLAGDDDLCSFFTSAVARCIDNAQLKNCAQPLFIPAEVLEEHLRDKSITVTEKSTDYYRVTATSPDGKKWQQVARLISPKTNLWSIYLVANNGSEEPVQVVAHQNNGPYIADIDILWVAWPMKEIDYSDRDKLLVPAITTRNLPIMQYSRRGSAPAASPESMVCVRRNSDPSVVYKAMDPELGNITQREARLITLLNKATGKHDNPVFQHGADCANPDSEEAANYPAIVIFPGRLVGKSADPISQCSQTAQDNANSDTFSDYLAPVAMIHDSETMSTLTCDLDDRLFHVRSHPMWQYAKKKSNRILKTQLTITRFLSDREGVKYMQALRTGALPKSNPKTAFCDIPELSQ